MPLVDYDSSSSASSSPSKKSEAARDGTSQPDAKRRRVLTDGSSSGGGRGTDPTPPGAGSDMPPLPSTFYDLYASTVRQSNVDDPSLHHGRKRQTPHIAGNWPSHLYVEWFPTAAQHDVLAELLQHAKADVGKEAKLHSFLRSDLGAHLPLHISLSRPINFSTAEKEPFLESITTAIRTSGINPFKVRSKGLAWYRSPDSNRSFLILRVSSASGPNAAIAPNPELSKLLVRCNATVNRFGQPSLYQQNTTDPVGNAFHVSIAWTFDRPSEETCLKTLETFDKREFRQARAWDIDVSGVKVKIGNVVSHVPLTAAGSDGVSSKDSIFS